MAYKLAISDRVEFDVRFTLNDSGADKQFGLRLAAKRETRDVIDSDLKSGMSVADFLAARGIEALAWIGKAPLVDEDGDAVPAGADALKALHELIGGFTVLVYHAYLEACGAKGRAGN